MREKRVSKTRSATWLSQKKDKKLKQKTKTKVKMIKKLYA